MKRNIIILIFFTIFLKINSLGCALFKPSENGYYLEEQKIYIIPEAERNLDYIIIGLWPINEKYVFVPEIKKSKNITNKEFNELKKNIYLLNLELTHGNIFKKIPNYTKIFVGLQKSTGKLEKKFFIEYLKKRCGFTDNDIKKRVYFFNTKTNLIWTQDTCEILGKDEKNKNIIGMANDDFAMYLSAIKGLANKYKNFFTIKWFEDNTSAEGGDLEIITMPDKTPALMIGWHRIMRYLELKYDIPVNSKDQYKQWMIEEARTAYSNSIYGIPVYILPEKLLYNKNIGTDEIFHLDMYLVALPAENTTRAFIPIYDKNNIEDILFKKLLDKEFIKKCNEVYDAAAEQLIQLGFDVIRIPFYDHPVRNPANVAKFKNKETGKITIFLGKYPYHISKNGELSPQQKLQDAIFYLENALNFYQMQPDKNSYTNILLTIEYLFRLIDEEEKTKNPIAEKQAEIYRKYGYDVVLVQQYAWASGGLHCSLLY
ncbi:MAG: hypothetical protein N2114_05155 [Candidatus Goldbacteria bacterium]|nr:hypothetical protein [Candidatus Goldiibacteriota bacterium]